MSADLLVHLALATLATSAAVVAVLALRRAMRRSFGVQSAYLMWALVPLAALATGVPARSVPSHAAVLVISPPATGAALVPSLPVAAVDTGAGLLLIWFLGVVLCAALFVRQQRRFVAGLGRVTRIGTGLWRAERGAGCPALVGVWRARIVLPDDFDQRYPPDQRELVIAHETLHRARGDAQANAVAAALRCLFWFNPLMHRAARCFCVDQELACDAAVIARFPAARRRYADALLKTQLAAAALPAGCHWQSPHPLKERIAMLEIRRPDRRRRASGLALVLVCGSAASYLAWAAQPPRLSQVPVASDAQVVDARITVTVGQAPSKEVRLVNPVGAPFSVSGDGDDPWQAEFVATPADAGNIRLAMTLRQDGAVIASPEIVARPATPASVRVGADDGSDRFRLDATLALHEAGWKPAVAAPAAATRPAGYAALSPPAYPASAIRQHEQAAVLLEIEVGAHGHATSVRIVRVDPPSANGLAQAAATAVNSWTFDPALRAGIATPALARVPIRFRLEGEAAPAMPAMPAGTLDMIDVVGAVATRG
jgi:TonB family protein